MPFEKEPCQKMKAVWKYINPDTKEKVERKRDNHPQICPDERLTVLADEASLENRQMQICLTILHVASHP
ncbi:hypothetical protein AVEN_132848-1 [Araneus ventricosus]|uniref:Uncharacterized protein n=1 Tax=Araneus ventricosus TaxID=182803 RepID=A0A4Y2HFG8_ARAVE|nr:hypothetical protein AVEN_132848-1 [Araneus ventricosus]